MIVPPTPFRTLACVLALTAVAHAQSALPADPVRLDSLAAFRPIAANWQLAGDLAGDPRRDKTLTTTAGTGVLVCNPGKDKETRGHLFTAWEHGDLEVELEFLMAPGSNSGVYLQGRYEVQLFDSWGVREPKDSDCGGIYQRWDATRGQGREGFEGHAPRTNACRAPGLWQRLRVEFEAPRFDTSGKKTKNARFAKVVLNGFTIHENVEVNGPTRSGAYDDEKALGPLMVQGDHGAVALRNLRVKRFETGTVLRAWRGFFLDTAQMWDGRGNDQTANPTGPALTFHGKPTLASIESAANGGWPDQPEALWSSQGYELEADGTPVFLGTLAEISVRDRIGAAANGRGLTRTLGLTGKLPSWSTWVLLAESTTITPAPGGHGWVIGEREWFLDWPADAPHRPVVRTVNGHQQLAVALTAANLEQPITYTIVW